MFKNLDKYNIILASNSPRRKELLSQLGIPFTVKTLQGIDESFPPNQDCVQTALYIVRQKSSAYRSIIEKNDLVITADTIVCIDHEVLGKPMDADEARCMLRKLSGRQHEVITAVGIDTVGTHQEFAVSTTVHFAELSDEIISFYIDNYKPFDKAGAYGIQEWIGYVGVEQIEGSFFNVMGLPVQRLATELLKY